MNDPTGAGFGTIDVSLDEPDSPVPATWWSGYAVELAASGIGSTSRAVIEADARHIVENGVLGAGGPGDARWPQGRVRTGAVMGAVQSGKTASMMAVAALALDAGLDAVVVLGGTRTALWLQTADRLVGQLDVLPNKATRRYMLPSPAQIAMPGGPEATSAYRFTSQQAQRAVEKHRPLVAVVMKNVAHLAEMATTLHEGLYPKAAAAGRSIHVLVIDDEADDSSIADNESTDPWEVRQVPRRIRDLWESRHSDGETTAQHVYATYLAYTATPQANFLQDPDNPLAPRDFFASLRTPGPDGDWRERTATYRVTEGARGWYTGGQTYYQTLADVPVCLAMEPTDDADEWLIDSVRAYLVASAVRLMSEPTKLGPASARKVRFTSREDARHAVAGPMSMLVHPSSAKDPHFDTAARILAWAAGVDEAQGRALLDSGARVLSSAGIRRDLDEHEPRWRRWLEDYRRSAAAATHAMQLNPPPPVPELEDWKAVRSKILDELCSGTSVAVINSDEHADDRPQFSPSRGAGETWAPAVNLSTILVSGNVMSRGLTLEGLTTTFFSRRSSEPLADTQMQMQRWFGYRGRYIHLCRVVLAAEQLELFEHYHQNDEALRRDVLAAMEAGGDSRPPLAVLQSRRFLATGKIGNLRSTPLWPGPKPFIRLMNPTDADGDNLELVASLFGSEAVLRVPSDTGRQGLVLDRRRDLLETAELLDRLVYRNHRPGTNGPEAARWTSVEHHAEIERNDPSWPLYRPPSRASEGRDLGVLSPYWIAAYLRLWAAAVERHIPGMYTTDEPSVPWNLVDLSVKTRQQPMFSIGLRYGDGDPVTSGPLRGMPDPAHPMKRKVTDDQLEAGWGARGVGSAGIRGDETFDLRARGADMRLVAEGPRAPGNDGQVLFHLIQRDEGAPTLAVGVVLPLGGPDNIEATRGPGAST